MTSSTPKHNGVPPNYSISCQARLCLGHLRERLYLTDHQAKDFYDIDDLSVYIKELIDAGHVIFEEYIPVPGEGGVIEKRAYMLGDALGSLFSHIDKLNGIKLSFLGGSSPEELKQEIEMIQAILDRSFFLIRIDLLNKLGMKSKLTRVLQKAHDTRLPPVVIAPHLLTKNTTLRACNV